MSLTTFIYALCEPGTHTIRYIGKSKHPKQRLTEHISESITHKNHLGNWLRSLCGLTPNLIVLSEVCATLGNEEERRYISAARTSLGMNLVNGTDGGDGLTNPSLETREKLRKAITPRRREFIRNLNRGKKLSRAVKKKISEKNRGRKLTSEQREAGAEARRGLKRTGASSRFRGVYWSNTYDRWISEIRVRGRVIRLGSFSREKIAARVHDSAQVEFFGASAKLNFPVKCRD